MRRAHRFSWQCRPAVHGVTPAESRAESASESESEQMKLGAGQKKKKSPHLDSGVGTFLIRIDVKKRLPADVKGVPEKILASTTT